MDCDEPTKEPRWLRWLIRVCEYFRLLEKLDRVSDLKPPPGARALTQDEKLGKSPLGTNLDTLTLATEIAQRGFEWRDEETRRLADRANLLLSAASVVIGLGTAFAPSQRGFAANSWAKALLICALFFYLILALLMILALRPRPLPRETGYAVEWVWNDKASLHRWHQCALLKRVRQLDTITTTKACMVAIGAVLLAAEVLSLTLAILLGLL
jgi:hypothetical protein